MRVNETSRMPGMARSERRDDQCVDLASFDPERQGMTGTLFFVHGTGVRQDGYDRTMDLVEAGLIANDLTDFRVVGCQWGVKIGSQFDDEWRTLVAKTLPPETIPEGPSNARTGDADPETSTWEMLLRDPLMELRVVLFSALPEIGTDEQDDETPAPTLIEVVNRIAHDPPEVEGSGLGKDDLARAASDIAVSDELTTDGYGSFPATNRGLIRVVAQAIVASALARHRFTTPGSEPKAAVSAEARDAVVARIERAMAREEERLTGTSLLENRLVRFLQTRGTEFVRERRLHLMQDYAAPFLADVAFYLRHGETFRDYVEEEMRGLEPPVVAVGHSLGGVILVDLLSQGDRRDVELLVTAGTQAPLLYALHALQHLSPDDSATVPFAPWLNFYNPNDFLSFCAQPIFAHVPGIMDERIEPKGIPFPAAHSSYWLENRVFERISEVLAANRATTR